MSPVLLVPPDKGGGSLQMTSLIGTSAASRFSGKLERNRFLSLAGFRLKNMTSIEFPITSTLSTFQISFSSVSFWVVLSQRVVLLLVTPQFLLMCKEILLMCSEVGPAELCGVLFQFLFELQWMFLQFLGYFEMVCLL